MQMNQGRLSLRRGWRRQAHNACRYRHGDVTGTLSYHISFLYLHKTHFERDCRITRCFVNLSCPNTRGRAFKMYGERHACERRMKVLLYKKDYLERSGIIYTGIDMMIYSDQAKPFVHFGVQTTSLFYFFTLNCGYFLGHVAVIEAQCRMFGGNPVSQQNL